MISDYLKYLFQSGNEHSLHSPFLFDFYTKVVKDKQPLPDYAAIEELRKELLKNERAIAITDFGAGSKRTSANERKIKDIARNSQKSPKLAQLFYRIVRHYQYKHIFDLGTSLGLTTAYLAKANPSAQILTFEGCPETAAIATENFKKLHLTNLEIVVGNLDKTLEKELKQVNKIDFAFFDANHRYQPTVSYFEKCLNRVVEDTCFIFDDIYWSDEMKKAWQYIINHPQVTISLDMFWVGIVFFRTKQPKQHFVLRL